MNEYRVDIDLSLGFAKRKVDAEIGAIQQRLNSIGNDIKLQGLNTTVKGLGSQLETVAKDFGYELSRQLAKAQSSVVPKGLVAPDVKKWTEGMRLQPVLEWADRMAIAGQKTSSYLDAATQKARTLNAAMATAGANTAKFLNTAPIMRYADALVRAKERVLAFATALSSSVRTAISKFQIDTANATRALTRWNSVVNRNVSLLGMWWNHFGRIALGFTIAYRAMNAFGMLLQKTTDMIRQSIKESGELAALQGKLAMFTVMASKGQIGFSQAFSQSGQVVNELAKASIKSISSIEELGVAMDELAQAGVLVPPNLTKEFVSFADFTSLISQTTGDNVRQLRSEINALMEGQTRANNTLIRSMKNFGIITEADIKALRGMHDRAAITEKIMMKVHETWTKFIDKLLTSNPAVAFDVWEKSIRRLMTGTIRLVSESKGQFNIFATTLKAHIDNWNKMFSGDQANNRNVKQFAILFVQLNKVLDVALTAFEKMMLGIAGIATAFDNLDDSIKKGLKFLLVWEAMVLVWKASKMLSGVFLALNGGLISALTTVNKLYPKLVLTGLGIFFAANAFSVLTGYVIDGDKATKLFTTSIEKLTEAMSKLTFTMIGAYLGWKLGGPWGAVAGATGGAAIDLVNATKERNLNKELLVKELRDEQRILSAEIEKVSKKYKEAVAGREKDNYLTSWKNMYARYQEITQRIATLNHVETQKPESFTAAFAKQSIETISVMIDAGFAALKPLKAKLVDFWHSVTNPNIDLTSKLQGSNDPFQQITKSAATNLEDLDKAIGNISSDMYSKFIKAVNDGKVALADLYAVPAAQELQYQIAHLKDQARLLEQGVAWTKEGTTKWLEYSAGLANVNAEIQALKDNLANIGHMQQLTPAVSIAQRLQTEFTRIKAMYDDGSKAQFDALVQLRDAYTGALSGIEIKPDDKKQVDALTKYTEIMEELSRVSDDWAEGIRRGLNEITKPQKMEMFKDVTVSAFKSMEDALVNFTSQGKRAFKDMAESILQDLLRIIVRMQVIQPLANLMGMTFFANPFEQMPITTISAMDSATTFPTAIGHANGGWLNEKIIGLGLSTGRLHTFAENGPEYVTPTGQTPGTTINIINNTPAQVRTEEDNSGGMKRIDVYIDEIMAGKLMGGSKTSQVLRKMYGMQPALAGR